MLLIYQKKIRPVLAATFLGMLALLFAACSSTVAGSTPAHSGTNLANALDNAQRASGLQTTPLEYALLIWNPADHSLAVTLSLNGLTPHSTHPAHIHLGNCAMMGNILYPLHNVIADSQGKYIGTTIIPNVMNGIPASGWYVNVHQGPGLATPAQMAPIACSNVVNSNPKPDHLEAVLAPFSSSLLNQLASAGYALLTWNPFDHSLTATLNLSGLAPNSTHPAHIHLGNCTMMGNILYPLNNVVADSQGKYIGTTIIPNVMNGIPASGWYVNVHHGPALTTPAQMAPITCGNIVNSNPKPDHIEVIFVPFSSLFINQFAMVNKIASTVPGNGDVNPYGVAVVQQSTGNLIKGNILVSNFNNSQNLQGTGMTIVQISPSGQQKVFAQLSKQACPDGIGLTTALVELKRGWVIVGSLPTGDGKFANAKVGCLIVLNNQGQIAAVWHNNLINGPWDATVQEDGNGDQAALFVTNVLNGHVVAHANKTISQGNIVRFDLSVPDQGQDMPRIASAQVIATGFGELTDGQAALQGPTGLGLGSNGVLYVADTVNSRLVAIPNSLSRMNTATASKHVLSAKGSLNGELGLAIAPNGDILTVNGNDGSLVETTPAGMQIATKQISTTVNAGTPPGAGCLFGLAVVPNGPGVYFVDDCTNQLNIFH